MENLNNIEKGILSSLKKYITELKKRVLLIRENLPEFWMHGDLREIQVILKIIEDLKKLLKQEDVEYIEEDCEIEEIKSWLYTNWKQKI